jgi:hypothetical protein
MRGVLLCAGVYNLGWGTLVVAFPLEPFRWARMEAPNYPEIWQCLGMVVGVYGVGYLIAARNPLRHWPIVLVGFLGKVLGPLGFLWYAGQGRLPWRAGWLNVTNDVVWLWPFAVILVRAFANRGQQGDAA